MKINLCFRRNEGFPAFVFVGYVVLPFDFCSIDRGRFQISVFVVFGYCVLYLLVLLLFFSIHVYAFVLMKALWVSLLVLLLHCYFPMFVNCGFSKVGPIFFV